MKLSAKDLKEILDIAKEPAAHPINDIWGYNVCGYHFFVYTEEDINDKSLWYIIEPNKLDEDGAAEPCGEIEEVPYRDYAQLLIACVDLAERYFVEEPNKLWN